MGRRRRSSQQLGPETRRKAVVASQVYDQVSTEETVSDSEPEMDVLNTNNALTPLMEKLDTIGEDIKGIKTDISGIQTDLSDLKLSINHATDTAQEALDKTKEHDQKFIEVDNEFVKIRNDFAKSQTENKQLREQLLKNECYNRRENLIIEGIPETINESNQACLESVYRLLEEKLKIPNARDIKISRCHRKQVKSKTNPHTKLPEPRPIIFKAHFAPDRERIWKARSELKDSEYWLSEDFPVEIVKRRKTLNLIRKKAIQEGSKASVSVDKLRIDGRTYTMDTLHMLPTSLHPREVFTRRSTLYTAFYSSNSPMSNFHPARFKVNGRMYLHSEQFYQCKKAEENGDPGRAREIMNTDDPLKCYQIGQNVSISIQNWNERALEIMFDGCFAKFEQNQPLKEFLLSTNTTVLLNASPFDKFWGIGLGINHPDIFTPEAWPEGAKNWLGKVLSKVRDRFRPPI